MGGTKLGDIFPNAAVNTTEGEFDFRGEINKTATKSWAKYEFR